jgi:hypothetical protein
MTYSPIPGKELAQRSQIVLERPPPEYLDQNFRSFQDPVAGEEYCATPRRFEISDAMKPVDQE